MSTIAWTGAAPAIAQVRNFVFAGTWSIGDQITFHVGQKTWTYAITSATIATFLPLLATAYGDINSESYPELAEATASSASTTFTLTANTAGYPFIITLSTNSGSGTIDGGSTSSGTDAPVSSGPYDVSTAANYSSGALPQSTLTAPVQNAVTATAGGSLSDSTTYYYVLTSLNTNGETAKGNQESITISGSNQTAVLSWTAVPYATGYKIYRSTTSNTYGTSSLLTTISSGSTTTFNDTGSATGTGQPPSSSSAIGDTLVIDLEGAQLLYNLQALSGITLTAREITAQDVTIGLPQTNANGYTEYRQTYWQISTPSDYVNTQSTQIQLDLGSVQTAFQIDASGSSGNDEAPAVLLRGSNSSNVWNLFGGEIGLAYYALDTAEAATINVQQGVTLICGQGATIATLNNYGGTVTVNSGISSSLNHPGLGDGTTTVEGSGAVAGMNLQSGTCYYNSTGVLCNSGNVLLANDATLSFDQDQRLKTVPNAINVYSSQVSIVDSYGVVTSNGSTVQMTIAYVNCPGSVALRPNAQIVVTNA